jgi:hypothetical protein
MTIDTIALEVELTLENDGSYSISIDHPGCEDGHGGDGCGACGLSEGIMFDALEAAADAGELVKEHLTLNVWRLLPGNSERASRTPWISYAK